MKWSPQIADCFGGTQTNSGEYGQQDIMFKQTPDLSTHQKMVQMSTDAQKDLIVS